VNSFHGIPAGLVRILSRSGNIALTAFHSSALILYDSRDSDPHSDPADRGNGFLQMVDSNTNELFYSFMVLQRMKHNTCIAKTG
jgi:hypothetical protein